MKKLLYLIFLVFLSEVYTAEKITEVSGVEGEPISINCSYSPQKNQWREKSWCKHISEATCQHVVSARRFWLPFLKRRNGTTAIADNIKEGLLMVTINPLQKQDAGWYQCMTRFLGTVKTLQKVKVNVLTNIENRNVQETHRILHSISGSPSNAGINLTFLAVGFLGFKFLVAIIILIVARSKKKRTTGNENRGENQHFHLPIITEQTVSNPEAACNPQKSETDNSEEEEGFEEPAEESSEASQSSQPGPSHLVPP